jgi:pimeloyl-ACP methyl ester carboxylesterase
MPLASVNGIRLHYDEYGSGDPVILIAGSGSSGRVWKTHQVPALVRAGYRVITVDNRGIPPSDVPAGITVADMRDDIAGLIDFLRVSPCRAVGVSLGAIVVQELLVQHGGLVDQAVLIATRGRTDEFCMALATAETEFLNSDIKMPARYAAVMRAFYSLSPRTLGNDDQIRDWLDIFAMTAGDLAPMRAHLGLDMIGNRLAAYRSITARCLVIAFENDLLARPGLCREVAGHINGSEYLEIPGCGHLGYLENPGQVNAPILEFFGSAASGRQD